MTISSFLYELRSKGAGDRPGQYVRRFLENTQTSLFLRHMRNVYEYFFTQRSEYFMPYGVMYYAAFAAVNYFMSVVY